jgi:hypothetical protein
VSLQSRDIQQLLRKLSKVVCNCVSGRRQGRPCCKRRSVSCRIQNAFCYGVSILQHGLPWRRRPETLSRVNYKQTLRVFLIIVVYRVIVGALVTSLWTCESVTFLLNCSVCGLDNLGSVSGMTRIFHFATASRPSLGSTLPPVQLVLGPGRDLTSINLVPGLRMRPTLIVVTCRSIRTRDNFTFTLNLYAYMIINIAYV